MVAPAGRAEVALVGRARGPGDGVVEVAVDGTGAATGRGTGRGAGAHKMAENAAGGVPVLAVAVITAPGGDRGERDVEGAQQRG